MRNCWNFNKVYKNMIYRQEKRKIEMKIAGIVLYNPDINRLCENIRAVEQQVDLIICVDNNSRNLESIKYLFNEHKKCYLICNKENEGIARALNQIISEAKKNNVDWVLTLDQDSVVKPCLIEKYTKYINIPNIAMITSIIEDRNSSIQTQMGKDVEIMEIKQCITSGTYTNVNAVLAVGGFDEKMFIDMVDFDLCLTLRENGYKIERINYCGLLHEVGRTKDVNFLGKKQAIYNHSAFRKYYITRNRIYYIKKHKKSLSVFKEYLRLLKYIILVLIFEDNKGKKFHSMLKGICDSNKM